LSTRSNLVFSPVPSSTTVPPGWPERKSLTRQSKIAVRSTVTPPPQPRPYFSVSNSTVARISAAFGSRNNGRLRVSRARAASGMNSVC